MPNLTRRQTVGSLAAAAAALTLRPVAAAEALYAAPRGLIAVDKMGGRVLFLDPERFETLKVLDGFPPDPHELAIAPDGRRAYVPIYGSGIYGDNPDPGHTIAVIDLERQAHAGDIDTLPYRAPHTLRFAPDGLLYVCSDAGGYVLVVDPNQGDFGRVVDAIDVGTLGNHRLSITPDGRTLFTENEEARFASVIDLQTRALTLRIPMPGGTAGIAVAPDGRTLVLTHAKQPLLIVVDPATRSVTAKVPLTGHTQPAQIVRYSPDGRYLVVTSLAGGLASIFEGGPHGRQRTVRTGAAPMDMAFHPDGRRVVIGNQGDGTLSVIDLVDARELQRPAAGRGVECLSFY